MPVCPFIHTKDPGKITQKLVAHVEWGEGAEGS